MSSGEKLEKRTWRNVPFSRTYIAYASLQSLFGSSNRLHLALIRFSLFPLDALLLLCDCKRFNAKLALVRAVRRRLLLEIFFNGTHRAPAKGESITKRARLAKALYHSPRSKGFLLKHLFHLVRSLVAGSCSPCRTRLSRRICKPIAASVDRAHMARNEN